MSTGSFSIYEPPIINSFCPPPPSKKKGKLFLKTMAFARLLCCLIK